MVSNSVNTSQALPKLATYYDIDNLKCYSTGTPAAYSCITSNYYSFAYCCPVDQYFETTINACTTIGALSNNCKQYNDHTTKCEACADLFYVNAAGATCSATTCLTANTSGQCLTCHTDKYLYNH